MKYRFLTYFLTFGLLLSSSLGFSQPVTLDRMIASVNHEAITESELDFRTKLLMFHLQSTGAPIPPESKIQKQLLERIILEKLQLQLASSEDKSISEKVLDDHIAEMAKQDNLTVPELSRFLEDQGIPFDKYRNFIKNEAIIAHFQQREVGQTVHITPSEVERFMATPAGKDQSGTEYKLGHILIALPEDDNVMEAKKTAQKVLEALKKGESFQELAMQYSQGQHALEGGSLGWQKLDAIPTLFVKVVPTLSVGEIAGPIENSSGFHIIKLLDKKTPENNPTNAKEKVIEVLYRKQFEERLIPWLRQLRSEAEVTYY